MYRGLILDLDNTLIDQRAAMRSWLGSLGLEGPIVGELLARDNWGYSSRQDLCSAIARATALGGSSQLWDRLRAELGDHVRAEPERAAMLARLSAHYDLLLLSNGSSANQRRKLAAAGLDIAFAPERVLISGEWGQAKPAPSIFAEALRRLAMDAAEVLMVGDDPRNDIEGAHRVGIATCWISGQRRWPHAHVQPTWTIATVEELEALLSLARKRNQ